MSDHVRWEELAAGHALDALEPEEDAEFTAHLAGCARCAEVLADHAFVAAQLGQLVDPLDVSAPSWASIREGVVPTPAPVTSLEQVRARRRSPRLLSAAAAALLVAGAGAVWVASSSREQQQSPQQATLAACAASPGCHVVNLQGKASLVVSNGSVRLLSSSLPVPAAGKVYALWQLPRGGRMLLVGSLRATAAGTVGESHALVLPYEETTAFGLSLEPSTVVPTAPSEVVALGSA